METTAANAFIRATLLADTALTEVVAQRIYCDIAPPGAALPFVVYSLISASDVGAVGGDGVVLTRLQYIVKGVCEGASYTPLITVGDRIQATLHKAHNATQDGFLIQGIQRERPIQYPERIGDKEYRHLGGLYRVFINKAG